MFLGRERRRSGPLGSVLRMLDKKGMKEDAGTSMANLGIATVQNMGQAVETLIRRSAAGRGSCQGGDLRQQVRCARRANCGIGVKETGQVLNLIQQIKEKGSTGDLDQPQHAKRVRGVGPDPYRQARRLRRGDHAEVAHAD
jgi:fructose transport system ATP-binding protein